MKDQSQLSRISADVAALNVYALERLRAAVNNDPREAARCYGLTLLTAQRLGRLPHTALSRIGDVSVPMMRPELDGLGRALDLVGVAAVPGERAEFIGSNDPDLARLYLQVVRQDTWRNPLAAAARWSWPLRLAQRLAGTSVTDVLLLANSLVVHLQDSPALQQYLSAIEAAPLDVVSPIVRLSAIASLGTSAVGQMA